VSYFFLQIKRKRVALKNYPPLWLLAEDEPRDGKDRLARLNFRIVWEGFCCAIALIPNDILVRGDVALLSQLSHCRRAGILKVEGLAVNDCFLASHGLRTSFKVENSHNLWEFIVQ
jgi:hypothetical protein